MKKKLLYITLLSFFAIFFPLRNAFSKIAVRCPVPKSSQGNVNHIFFSFFKKEDTVGSYIPKNLVLINPVYTKNRASLCLTKQAYVAFTKLNDALIQATGQGLHIGSAWRSLKTQEYFAKTRAEFAAVPGRSEHHLGTTIDISVADAKEEDYFGSSPQYQWMVLHAHEYGFIQSFDTKGESVTGIPNEPWHWRFVGKTIAKKVKDESLILNEYLFERKEAKKKTTQ